MYKRQGQGLLRGSERPLLRPLAEARSICEVPQLAGWEQETIKQIKLLAAHLTEPLLFRWISTDRVEVDVEASRALQRFYGDVLIPYMEDGKTTPAFAARVARHQRAIDTVLLEAEVADIKGGSQRRVDDLQKELKALTRKRRRT